MVQPAEGVEDLDRMFDILLVLLGIVTATLFQFICVIVPLQVATQNPDLSQDLMTIQVTQEITRWLRVFFIPLILLIGIWFFNRIALASRPNAKRTMSEVCYVMGFTILAHDIMYFAGAVMMQPLIKMTASNIGGGPYSLLWVISVIVVSFGLIYRYETLAIPETEVGLGRKRRRFWRNVFVRTIVMWFIAMGIINWIEMLSIYEFI